MADGAAAPCERLDWDSAHFGFGIARVVGGTLDEEGAAAVDSWCEANGVRCLYFLADPDDPETSRVAAGHGFRMADLRIVARRSLEEDPPAAGSERVVVRDVEEGQLESLRSLAARSYRGTSRFYLDGGFPAERCDALYVAWIDRGWSDPERAIEVANVEGEPAGYQVVGPVDSEGARRLELVAIDPALRGAGVGMALISETMRKLRREGAPSTWTVLSARNIPTLRLHERLGFLAESAGVWHHKWYGGE
jgi:GNAT superfamily N-acetyltransferase